MHESGLLLKNKLADWPNREDLHPVHTQSSAGPAKARAQSELLAAIDTVLRGGQFVSNMSEPTNSLKPDD